MYDGVDYYPEHWPRKRWPGDAALMRKAGFTVVRLAEFNWVNMEPVEGVYDFSVLDKVLPLPDDDAERLVQQPPAGVEVSVRRGAPHELIFLINHTEEPRTVNVPPRCTHALTQQPAPRALLLERHGVIVLRRARRT